MSISPEQLSELLDRHWGPLVAWVGPRGNVAEDVVQRAFIALSAESHSPGNPVAWLYATARNLANNERKQHLRRERRHQAVARPESQACTMSRTEPACEVMDQLNQLPDEAREIVVARIWGGLNFEEISRVVQKSPATVWRHYNAALNSLREIYGVPCEMKN